MLARMQGVAARLVKGPARKAELTRAESCGELMGLAQRGGWRSGQSGAGAGRQTSLSGTKRR